MAYIEMPTAIPPISDQYKIRMAYGVNPDPGSANEVLLYVGWALPKTADSVTKWRIAYYTYDSSDRQTKMDFPQNSAGDESAEFAFEWDERANYTYGA